MAKIYLIDDDLAASLVAENLSQRGHDVGHLSSVDEALRNAGTLAQADLVILDLVMPCSEAAATGSSDGVRSVGMQVYQELRRRNSNLPILVFTANQDRAVVEVIESDPHARYVSRWSSPKFRDFVMCVHEMLHTDTLPPTRRAFIVHGHDDQTKLEVKNFLQNSLGLPEPIILHEQPNKGRTIVEKFEDLATSADLAFVLLTPDDHFAAAGDGAVESWRARQNVIFELGFFLAALGRRSGKVLLLYKGPLDVPTDLSGVVYIDISKGLETASEKIRLELADLRT